MLVEVFFPPRRRLFFSPLQDGLSVFTVRKVEGRKMRRERL